MKFFKQEQREDVKVSLILLDWSVRESPHILHYLRHQTVPQDQFEVIYIEFYDRQFEGLRRYEDRVDVWVALEMPKELYYAKHLMYNAGIVLARGEIIVVCDLDALVRETFIERIIQAFDGDPQIVFHIDQFRSMRREFYPFNFPSVEQVMGEGCINNAGGVTSGLRDSRDTIHTRNYGSCFCAKRSDIIAIGGADMHIDYVGHICGPYDMSFRLRNLGRRIVWAEDEFMYHTWHPGTDGGENYLGPHDGQNFSTTAMESLVTGDLMPLQQHPALHSLRSAPTNDPLTELDKLIEPFYFDHWRAESLIERAPRLRLTSYRTPLGVADGRFLWQDHGQLQKLPLIVGSPALSRDIGWWDAVRLGIICALFRWVDVIVELLTTYVPLHAARFPAPIWVRTWILGPILIVLFPLSLLRSGRVRRRIRILTGEFRDLSNPIKNLALTLREIEDSAGRDIVVVHDRPIALWTFRVLSTLKLVPPCSARLIRDGKALASVIRASAQGRSRVVTVVPSGLYVRYHLDVPPITALPGVFLV